VHGTCKSLAGITPAVHQVYKAVRYQVMIATYMHFIFACCCAAERIQNEMQTAKKLDVRFA
jgi:hypothetical protein